MYKYGLWDSEVLSFHEFSTACLLSNVPTMKGKQEIYI